MIAFKQSLVNGIRYPKICYEAYKRGKQSEWFMTVDWKKHLNKTTKEVKEIVNLQNPPVLWNKYLNLYMKLHSNLKRKAAA